MLQVGDYVKHKETGIIGKVTFSTFGFSIHYRNEEGKLSNIFYATEKAILRRWDKCNSDGELID